MPRMEEPKQPDSRPEDPPPDQNPKQGGVGRVPADPTTTKEPEPEVLPPAPIPTGSKPDEPIESKPGELPEEEPEEESPRPSASGSKQSSKPAQPTYTPTVSPSSTPSDTSNTPKDSKTSKDSQNSQDSQKSESDASVTTPKKALSTQTILGLTLGLLLFFALLALIILLIRRNRSKASADSHLLDPKPIPGTSTPSHTSLSTPYLSPQEKYALSYPSLSTQGKEAYELSSRADDIRELENRALTERVRQGVEVRGVMELPTGRERAELAGGGGYGAFAGGFEESMDVRDGRGSRWSGETSRGRGM